MDRSFYPSQTYGFARVYMEFFFLTNGSSSPVLSSTNLQGVGLDVVSSITRTGTGVLVVQLSPRDHFFKVIYKTADLDDTPGDGAYATVGTVNNEGTSSGIQFTVTTRAAAGTATDYSARKCNVQLAFRNSNTSNPA